MGKHLFVGICCLLWTTLAASSSEIFDTTKEASWLHHVSQLTFPKMGFEKAGEAYFSPDGETILFQAVPVGSGHYQIYSMNLREGIPRMVSTGKGACTCAYFRPDGKKIIFASSHSDPLWGKREKKETNGSYRWDLTPYMNIYEANPDGTGMVALTSGEFYHAECAYSNDGTRIVYASNEEGSMNLYTMNADGSDVRQITHTTGCYNGGPFFSPDDTKIVFRADRESADYLQIYVIDTDGTDERQITSNPAVNWAPYWHPNGRVVAFTTSLHGHSHYEIYLIDVVTGADCRLTYNETFDGLPVFNTDGSKLMWTSKRGDDRTCQIFLADFTMPTSLMEILCNE